MGEVYEAEHVEIGAKAAIKFLAQECVGDSSAFKRFQREARIAGTIGHGVITSVLDVGATADGSPYLVMELLNGQPLSRTLSMAGRIDPELTAYVGCQVLSGLAAAHEVGVVHRDLKPDNIFLIETGAALPGVKILDFGISRVIGGSDHSATRLTQTGTVIGTPEYMSPEQARGQEDIDSRSDLFSLGVILYECVTGEVPFQGSNYNAVLMRILSDNPREPSRIRPGIPSLLEAMILKSLSKARDQRFGSAVEMFDALLPFVEERAAGLVPNPSRLSGVRQISGYVEPEDGSVTLSDTGPAAVTDLSWESGEITIGSRSSIRTWVLLGILLLTTFAGGATGLLYWGASRGGEGLEGATAAPGTAERDGAADQLGDVMSEIDAPAEPELLSIALHGVPESARIHLDGELVTELPLRLQRGGDTHELRIEAEGFEPYQQLLSFQENGALTPLLRPVEAPPAEAQPDAGRPRRPGRHGHPRNKANQGPQPGYFIPLPEPGYLGDQ